MKKTAYTAQFIIFLALLCADIVCVLPLRAQTDSVFRKTIITAVKVQGREIPVAEWGKLIIAQNDSISFTYACEVSGGKQDPLLFNITLRDESGQERVAPYRVTSLRYAGLAEQNYTFSVQAYSPSSQWKAQPATLRFTVNNAEAEKKKKEWLAKEQERLEIARRDSAKKHTSIFSFSMSNALYWGIGGFVLVGLIAVVWQIIRQKMRQQSGEKPRARTSALRDKSEELAFIGGNAMMNEPQLSYDQLLKENANLKAEIAALRGEMEAMQTRTDELKKANKQLADQKERILENKKQLEELQSQKDDLFAMVVHDIKNPAGLIKGLVELLRSYDLSAQEQGEIMEDLLVTSAKILSLAQEVSRVMALESGSLKLAFNQFPLQAVVEDVCRRNSHTAVQKNIKIIQDISPGMPDAEFDVQKVEEAMDNLVSNAIKFSHKGAEIRVRAYKGDVGLTVEVIDNGLGLSEDDVRKAFGRGTKLAARPTGGETSSGLGLWIVKRIIEAHNGRVWLKSTLGKGSTFAFSIPLKQNRSLDS